MYLFLSYILNVLAGANLLIALKYNDAMAFVVFMLLSVAGIVFSVVAKHENNDIINS